MKDIENREDIDLLMRRFYAVAMPDDLIGHIFTDVAKLDLEKHLPIIGDFWESLLFGTPVYAKHGRSPMVVHGELHAKYPLTTEHFERWLEIFTRTIDEEFAGERTEFLKVRSRTISGRLQEFLHRAD